jgi:signal recognition particle receptor subunit beta
MESIEMQGVPVTVIANKQDLPGAMSPAELVDKLHLRKLTGHKWHIQGTCAVNGDGIFESMQAMADLVKQFKAERGY